MSYITLYSVTDLIKRNDTNRPCNRIQSGLISSEKPAGPDVLSRFHACRPSLDPGLRRALRVRRGVQPEAGHHVVLQREDHRGRRQVQDQEQRQHQDAHDQEDHRGRRRRVQVS